MPKKTAAQIIDSGNHYVLQVKQNQPSLYENIKEVILQQRPLDEYTHQEKKRGQQITWETKVYEVIPNQITQKWEGIQRFISTKKTCIKKDTIAGRPLRRTAPIESTTFRITDITHLSAEKLSQGIRGHWGIENQLHWVRDVNFKQDKNKITQENAAVNMAFVNMAFFNTIAINYLRKNGYFKKSCC